MDLLSQVFFPRFSSLSPSRTKLEFRLFPINNRTKWFSRNDGRNWVNYIRRRTWKVERRARRCALYARSSFLFFFVLFRQVIATLLFLFLANFGICQVPDTTSECNPSPLKPFIRKQIVHVVQIAVHLSVIILSLHRPAWVTHFNRSGYIIIYVTEHNFRNIFKNWALWPHREAKLSRPENMPPFRDSFAAPFCCPSPNLSALRFWDANDRRFYYFYQWQKHCVYIMFRMRQHFESLSRLD